MESHQIRYCQLEEVDKLQDFLDQYWKKGHILATNKTLLDFQHKNEKEGRYNFVVAYNNSTQLFDIILGFIPYNHYDPEWDTKKIWLAIWKKNDQPLPRGMGKKLLEFVENNIQPSTIGGIGINDTIEQLYLKRGWQTGKMKQWYFLNPGRLISYEERTVAEKDYFFNPHHKSDTYYLNRYDRHPFYKYETFQGVVYRKIETELGNCLRIIDFKKHFYLNDYYLRELAQETKVDYIDCFIHGMSAEVLEQMGFTEKPEQMRIPQWFEPLNLSGKNIKYTYSGKDTFFGVKGDADQDRPSVV
mgnify:CR=1 FL=1